MNSTQYHVKFYDSSDEEESAHLAVVVPVAGSDTPPALTAPPANDGPPRETSSFWLSRTVGRAINLVASTLWGGRDTGRNESVSAFPNSLGESSDDGQWNFRAHCRLPFHEDATLHEEFFASSEHLAVDLREVILQYRRTPYDVYMRIILAALNFGEVQINGDVFAVAAGSREVVKCLLQSGKVNVSDPVVQQVIQSEIDSVIKVDEAHGDRVDPDDIEYLGLLCRLPSATLTKEQARHCRQAGFEFTKMLYENPHVLRNIPPPYRIVARLLDFCYILNMIMTWLGLITVLLNFTCIAWFAYNWFSHGIAPSGFWTLLCYVAGHVGCIVVGMLSEEGRIRDYDDRIWNYPHNSLKVIPCIPVFAIALMYVTLRYELLRDKAKYFVIRHDLYNALANFLIMHTIFLATPQLLLQCYLCVYYQTENDNFVAFSFLTAVHYALFGMSMYLFLWKVLFQYSCNSFGFAVMTVKQALVLPIDVTTRVLIVTTYLHLECNFMTFAIFLTNIYKCLLGRVVFILTGSIMTLTMVVGLTFLIMFKALRFLWLVCVPAILFQVIFIFGGHLFKGIEPENPACLLFSSTTSIVSPFVYVAFGCMCISFFAWATVALHNRITGHRPFLHWDNYFYWSRGR